MSLQNLEDPLEEECEKILFEHFVSCYEAFYHRIDDYSDELNNLEANLMKACQVDNNAEKMAVSGHNMKTLSSRNYLS